MRSLSLLLTIALALAACEPADPPAETPAETPAPTAEETPAPPSQPVNLNTGTAEEFGAIPGVGERMIHEFEEYRPYASIEQFRREIGKYVDEAQVAEYERYVFVPVSVDEADAATLQQLPGVGEAEATALMEGRPYGSNEAFMTRYAEVVPGADSTAAALYLAE